MSKTVTIALDTPIIVHGGVATEVVLREPTFNEFIDLGDPIIWTRGPDGSIFAVENAETIREYIARCLVAPKDPLLLNQGGLKLAKQVKAAILAFFQDGDSETEISSTSPTSSSSDATSPPATSDA